MTLYALLLGLVEPETVAVVAADGGAAMACAALRTKHVIGVTFDGPGECGGSWSALSLALGLLV